MEQQNLLSRGPVLSITNKVKKAFNPKIPFREKFRQVLFKV